MNYRVLRRLCACLLIGANLLIGAPHAEAGVASKALRETVEYISKKFGKEAMKEGAEAFAKRLQRLVTKYGDDCLAAARRVGPLGVEAIEQAGPLGRTAAKCLARHGEKALKLAGSRRALRLVSEFGDDAALAIIRHPGIAEELIETHGEFAARALLKLSRREGLRLAMMQQSGELAKLGHTKDLLTVIERYGDRAMKFIWRNKGPLAVSTVLVTFLRDPEPYISGIKELGETAIEGVGGLAGKAIEAAGNTATEVGREAVSQVAQRTNWTIVLPVVAAIIVAAVLIWHRSRKRNTGAHVTSKPVSTPQPLELERSRGHQGC